MKLTLFVPDLSGGGGEKAMLTLAQAFVTRGHDVELLLMRQTGAQAHAVPAGVTVTDLRQSRMLRALPALVAHLRRRQPDALVATLLQANVASVIARAVARVRTRVILCIESPLDAGRRDLAPTRALRLAYRGLAPILRRADVLVAVSEGIRRQLITAYGQVEQRVVTIFNPVLTADLPERAALPPAHPWLREKSGPVVVAAGRLHPAKDFETLMRAFAELRRHRPVRLVILGEGPERHRLDASATELGVAADVAIPGFVDNPYACFHQADVFVSSSRYEGFGNAIAEALACGASIVSTDCPFGPAEILDHGRLGRLVPVGDVAALANAMAAALDSRPTAAEPAWLRQFSADHVAGQYLAVMQGGPA